MSRRYRLNILEYMLTNVVVPDATCVVIWLYDPISISRTMDSYIIPSGFARSIMYENVDGPFRVQLPSILSFLMDKDEQQGSCQHLNTRSSENAPISIA